MTTSERSPIFYLFSNSAKQNIPIKGISRWVSTFTGYKTYTVSISIPLILITVIYCFPFIYGGQRRPLEITLRGVRNNNGG